MTNVNKKSSFYNLKPVSRRTFLKQSGIALSGLATSSIWSCRAVERLPNFIIIFTDDQGYADVGCYGATGFETPNLDRMAEEGLRFTSFYVSEAVCCQSGRRKKITLAFDPDPKYSKGGVLTLIDSQLGSDDFHDGHWLGFHGRDLEAVIDLGEMLTIRKIALSLLEEQIAWIFYPPEIEFAVSEDGQDFQIVGHQKIKLEPRRQSSVKIVEKQLSQKARFIRVRAKNAGECPSWHPGHAQKAWLFADEIIIQ